MPREQPFAQDLMQEALSSKGSHVEWFRSPTIFSGIQASTEPPLCRLQENTAANGKVQAGSKMDVSVHLNPLIFHSVCNHGDLTVRNRALPKKQNVLTQT